MNILIAPDKFKDALSATEICHFLQKGILQTFPKAHCTLLPLADGGEGTLESLNSSFKGEFIYQTVQNPLFEAVSASYLYIPQNQTAVVEMARASGIELLIPTKRNCLKTSSFGTGQLVKEAIQKGAKEIFLTVGGTATNDAGMGIASALGFRFMAKDGTVLQAIGENLIAVASIDGSQVPDEVFNTKFTIATDVTNPFFGESGAAYVFAKQKGANEEGIQLLDKGLQNMAQVLERHFGINPQTLVGSGAGGGVAGGLAVLLNANIISAASWILEINRVDDLLEKTNVLVTGEGKVDSQTWDGKLISQLLSKAEVKAVPVIIVCGTLQDIEIVTKQKSVLYATSILQRPSTLENALANTPQLLENQGMLLGKMLSSISLNS